MAKWPSAQVFRGFGTKTPVLAVEEFILQVAFGDSERDKEDTTTESSTMTKSVLSWELIFEQSLVS